MTHSVEPAGAGIFPPATVTAKMRHRRTKRAQTDDFAQQMYFRDNDFKVAAAAQQVASQHGVTPTQIACAWILQAPGVTAPIIGATKIHHLKELFDAVDITLSAEEVGGA